MARIPARNPDVLSASLGDVRILYAPHSEMVHVLNQTGAAVWAACDGAFRLDEFARQLSEGTGEDLDRVTSEVNACLEQLESIGVLGDPTGEPTAQPTWALASGEHQTHVFAVLDDGIVFHCDTVEARNKIDELFSSLADGRAATRSYGVRREASGQVVLTGRYPADHFGDLERLLDALPTELNQVAAANSACLTLHSGAVRSKGGVVLLPGVSGSGKTTLTAALVRSAYDYATDEAVGVRQGSLQAVGYPKPLELDEVARAVVGLPPSSTSYTLPRELRDDVQVHVGNAGKVIGVVLPEFHVEAVVALGDPLEPVDAFGALIEHALNLVSAGQPGLDALVQLAEHVPVRRLVHGGAEKAVEVITRLFPPPDRDE